LLLQAAGDNIEMQEKNKTGLNDKEEVIISWQQKIFSQVQQESP